MAYCIYCGRKLEEGETCNCRNVQSSPDIPGGQIVQDSQNNQSGQNVQSSQSIQGEQAVQNNAQVNQNPNSGNIGAMPQQASGQNQGGYQQPFQTDGQNQGGYQQPFQTDGQNQGGYQQPFQADGQNQGGYQQPSQINMQKYQENFNQAKEVSGIYLKRLLEAFVGVLRQPADWGKKLVESGDAALGTGFLAVQAILSSLFAMVICGKINGVGKAATSLLSDDKASNIISYPKTFLLTVIGSLVMSFAIAGLLYLGVLIFQGKTTFGKMICVVAVRAVGVSIFLVVSIVVVYLNVMWGIWIFVASWLAGLVFMIPAIKDGAEFHGNRLPYMVILVAILSIVVFYLWMRVSLPLYAPDTMKDQLEDFMNGLNQLGSLSSFL